MSRYHRIGVTTRPAPKAPVSIKDLPYNHRTLEAEMFAYYMADRLSPGGMHRDDLNRARSIAKRWVHFNVEPSDDQLAAYYHDILKRIDALAPGRPLIPEVTIDPELEFIEERQAA